MRTGPAFPVYLQAGSESVFQREGQAVRSHRVAVAVAVDIVLGHLAVILVIETRREVSCERVFGAESDKELRASFTSGLTR